MAEVAGQYIGQTLSGRYEITSPLGEGGFGLVFKARQLSTGQSVAIKLMQPELLLRAASASRAQIHIKRFQREMQLIAQLKHPNIVRLIDSGEMDDGQLFTVLEFIEGESLAQVLDRDGPLTPREAKHLMFQVLDGLSAAHELGIVHRDLKPDNIMLTRTGYRRNAMVLDFGVATVIEELRGAHSMFVTSVSEISGTPAYMAPEQVRQQKISPQADLYAWGLVLIECMTAKPALDCASVMEAALRQASDDDIPIPPAVDHPGLRRIIGRAIAKDLQARYRSAREVLADLDACDVSTWGMRPHAALIETAPGVSLGSLDLGATYPNLHRPTDSDGFGDTQENISAVDLSGRAASPADAFGETFDSDIGALPPDARAMLTQTAPQAAFTPAAPAPPRVVIKATGQMTSDRQHQPTVAYMEGVPRQRQQSQRLLLLAVIALAAVVGLMFILLFR
jgi:serine/threonine protein kinase